MTNVGAYVVCLSVWDRRSCRSSGLVDRLAMIGFAGILVTEALAGKTIPETYGLPHGTITAPAVGLLNMAMGFLHM